MFYLLLFISMMQEFVEFLSTYNVIGLAIGLVIGAQVTALAWSLIDDLITPLLLAPFFKKFKIDNLEELSRNGVLRGKVISNLIKFVVIALLVFVVVRNFDIPMKK